VPTIFLKLTSALNGPRSAVVLPKLTQQPDYEAEFAFVIGTGGKSISADTWEEHVFGYTIMNDVSARDVQMATSQWSLGKSFDTFAPLGPAIVTKDEVPDPHALDIRLTIGGEVLQHSNTRELIFRVPDLIAYLSAITPLEAGDIISTGTPAGVGFGRTPHRWLRPGETIVTEVESLGQSVNPVVGGVALDEILYQHQDIVLTFSQCRHRDWEYVYSIKQVLAKRPIRHGRLQVSIRGGNDSNINTNTLSAADTLKFPFLQHPE